MSAYVGKMDAIRVLFVEDDRRYRETVADELSEHGLAVQSFGDGASLLGSLDTAAEADVIVLNWTSGIDLLPQLRHLGVNLPVVFLTGHALTPVQECLAFDRGGSDFIDKARGMEVLVKRLRRVVEAAKPTAGMEPDNRMVYGKLVLRPAASRAYWDERDVGFTLGEYNIVHLLASNVGRYVSYRAIYDRMHYEGFIPRSGEDGPRANVRSAIRRIRNKFRACDPTFAEIENHTAFGYCWRKPAGTD